MAKKLQGMYKDVDPQDQPDQTYRHAENALLLEEVGSIMSDYGIADDTDDNVFDLSAISLSRDSVILGDVNINDDRVVLFAYDYDDSSGNESKVLLFEEGELTLVSDHPDLDFDPTSEIDTSYRINKDMEAIVYWTDDVNSPRFMNVDDPPSNSFDLDRQQIFDHISNVPNIDLNSINDSGGVLPTGTYYFAVAYVKDDGSRTSYTTVSPPIYINDDDKPIDTSYDGAPAGTPTNKSITLTIGNLDTSYDRLALVAVPHIQGSFNTPQILPEISIGTSNSVQYTYTGTESHIEGSIDEILIDNASYETAKTIQQVDDILYMGNLTRGEDIGYQKFANNIELKVGTEEITERSYDPYKDSEISFQMKGFQRDAVYAFYISFILNDGSESYAYHIPGRAPNSGETDDATNSNHTDVDSNGKRFHFENNPDPDLNTGYWENANETYPDNENWDIYDVDSNGDPDPTGQTLREDANSDPVPVRHHRMPSNRSFTPYINKSGGLHFNPINITLRNIKIPSSIEEKVAGIRIYYAKRTDNNKRIMDQGLIAPLKRYEDDQTNESDDVYFNAFTTELQFSGDVSEFSCVPFHMMRTELSTGGLTHLDLQYVPLLSEQDVTDEPNNREYTTALLETFGADITRVKDSSDQVSDPIVPIDNAAYVSSGQQIVELVSKGFDYNATTKYSESSIFMEAGISIPYTWRVPNGSEKEYGYIANLVSHKVDLYNSFDLQELVWTGVQINNVSQFNPANQTTSSAEIEATSDVPEIDESRSGSNASFSGNVETIVTNDNNYYYEFDFVDENDNVVATIQTTDIDPSLENTNSVAQIIADAINNVSGTYVSGNINDVINNWTANFVSSDPNENFEVVADNIGDEWNGYDIMNLLAYLSSDDSGIGGSDSSVTINGESSGGEDAFSDGAPNQSFRFDQLTYDDNNNEWVLTNSTYNKLNDNKWYKVSVWIYTINSASISVGVSTGTGGNYGTSVHSNISTYSSGGDAEGIKFENTQQNDGIAVSVIANKEDVVGIAALVEEYDVAPGDLVHDPSMVALNADNDQDDYVGYYFTPYQQGDTKLDAITRLRDDIQRDSVFTSRYSLNIDTSGANPILEITSDTTGDYYNISFSIGSGTTDESGYIFSSTDAQGSSTIYSVYGGDVYIGLFSYRISYRELEGSDHNINKLLLSIAVESVDNVSLRHAGSEYGEVYYPSTFYTDILSLEDEDDISDDQRWYDNYIGYNIDYSALADVKTAIPHPKTGVEVETNMPTRIIRSQEDDPSAQQDGFRQFLENDYKDLPGNRGELVKLARQNNVLIPHMERAIVRTKGREEMTTGSIRAYIGAGDIFAVPTDELVMTKTGTGGIQSVHHGDLTEYGYVFVDQQDAKIYMFGGEGLQPISQKGMRNYFEDALTWNLKQYSKDFNPYNIDRRLIGMNFGFDDEHSRLFFTKRDLSPTDQFTTAYSNGNITYNTSTDQFEDNGTPISYSDTNYFEEDNICLSFVPEIGRWVSFHDVAPHYYFRTLNNLYGLAGISSHDSQYWLKYNEKSTPLDVGIDTPQLQPEFVFRFVQNNKPALTKVFTSLQFVTDAEKNDGTIDYKKTFGSFRIYNKYQDSGERTITVLSSLGDGSNARHVEGMWRINSFRNLLVNGAVDTNKPWYERDRITGKYAQVELKYSNSDDYFLYLLNSRLQGKQSIR